MSHKALYQTTKMNFEELFSLTSFQKPQLLQSVLMILFYIFTEQFIPSFNVLSSYFYVSLNVKVR